MTEERLYTASMYGSAAAALEARERDEQIAGRAPQLYILDPAGFVQHFAAVESVTLGFARLADVTSEAAESVREFAAALSASFEVTVPLDRCADRFFRRMMRDAWRAHRKPVRQMKAKLRGKNWRTVK